MLYTYINAILFLRHGENYARRLPCDQALVCRKKYDLQQNICHTGPSTTQKDGARLQARRGTAAPPEYINMQTELPSF